MIWTVLFLGIVGFVLPLGAWLSHRQARATSGEGSELVSASAVAFQSILLHAAVFGLAIACARAEGIELWSITAPSGPAIGLASVVYAVFLTQALLEARRPLGPDEAMRHEIRKAGLSAPWIAAAVTAAIAEEVAYRGVLFQLAGGPLPTLAAAFVSALVFGLAHFAQGLRGVIGSFACGLALQALAHYGNGLMLPIMTHLAYDLSAAWFGRRIALREEAQR